MSDHSPQALIVDFGGVLTTDLFDCMRSFAAREGLNREALVRLVTTDSQGSELLAALERGDITQREFEAGIARRLGVSDENLEARIMADLRPDAVMLEAVAAVRGYGCRVAVLSNSWGLEPYSVYDGYDLPNRCDVLIYSEQVRLRKPDPAIFVLTARRLSVAPEACVFVDDVARNLEPARKMGMTVLHHVESQATAQALRRLFRLNFSEIRHRRDGTYR